MVGVRLLASAPAVALVDIIAGTEVAGTGITGGSPPKEKVGRVGGRADSGRRPPSCIRSAIWGGGGGSLSGTQLGSSLPTYSESAICRACAGPMPPAPGHLVQSAACGLV